jgi:hypothetical protein
MVALKVAHEVDQRRYTRDWQHRRTGREIVDAFTHVIRAA